MKKLFLRDNFILLLIILNAATIFFGGFDLGNTFNFIVSLLDNLFTILFIAELVIKLREYGREYFKSNWNRLDFTVILLSIPALLAFVLNIDTESFNLFLVLRVLRVFKSLRFLKFFPGIESLIEGMNRALKASVIVLLGFAIYLFIVGIFSFYLYQGISPEHYGNPIISLYSTFKIFTIEGWFDIPEEIVQSNGSSTLSFLVYLYFVFIVLTGGMLGLSLVNSVFVDAMVSDNTDELEKKVERLEMKIDRLLEKSEEKNRPE